ncbi:MAG: AraC family transcriptional regulator [Pseudomonadota bacterium]|nr:AraC family transcriptional regulator [Pseudomonadota bacterium]
MPTPELEVPARYYARFAEVLTREGIDLADIFRKLRIPTRLLTEPDAKIRISQVDRLIQELFTRTGRTDLAFDLGKLLAANAHSFVGFGMLSSATVDQALRFEAQYFRLIMPSFRMRYTSGPDFGEMHFTPRAAMSHLSLAFHLEAIAVAALREVWDLTGTQRPHCRLSLSIAEPPHARRYVHELPNVTTRFSADIAPSVKLRIDEDPRALRLAMADANALKLAESRCRTMVQQVADGGRFADFVEMTLREVSEGLPTLEELAATLNISKRTLNRYLEREGKSYRELSGHIQHELACERLSSGMSATEVAYSLGFKDRSNFSRAFRARAGHSPGRHAAPAGASRQGTR